MTQAPAFNGLLVGTVRMQHCGGFGFPRYELFNDSRRVAALGRDSSLKIMLGRGRRVVLANAAEWRIKAASSGPYIIPIIRAPEGTVARSGPLAGRRVYGIVGSDFAYTLFPISRAGFAHNQVWGVRKRDLDVAQIDQGQGTMQTTQPIGIAAVLLAFTLIEHGIPGEAKLRPSSDG